MRQTYENLCNHAREAKRLESILHLVEWDEQTQLPRAGGPYRAEQVALLARQVHRLETAAQVGDWLGELADSELASDPDSDSGAVIRLLRRDYDKKTCLPGDLVEELARIRALGQQTWVQARKNDDFAHFQPLLEQTVALKRQEAAAYGYEQSPYDPLLDDYEPDAKTDEVASVLAELRDGLTPLVQAIAQSPRQPDDSILSRNYPIATQASFGKSVAAAIGFDFDAGRLDTAVHPFCTRLGPHDTRLTTRFDEHDFSDGLFSILHEAGHGLYEQGLPAEGYGLPTGSYVSLAIHESQSRLWENQVARSRPFWTHFFPQAVAAFPPALDGVGADEFYAAVNTVRPSLIRVDADEVTYNLHILIRFELELALLEGDLVVADLPAAWNEKYQTYLGVVPPTDAAGVLQDVHWSAGLFGYFPTYALGNLYGAQFYAQAQQDISDLDAQLRRGEFSTLLEWLRKKIHIHGRRYAPAQLVQRVTGGPLSHDPLLRGLHDKFAELYDLE